MTVLTVRTGLQGHRLADRTGLRYTVLKQYANCMRTVCGILGCMTLVCLILLFDFSFMLLFAGQRAGVRHKVLRSNPRTLHRQAVGRLPEGVFVAEEVRVGGEDAAYGPDAHHMCHQEVFFSSR